MVDIGDVETPFGDPVKQMPLPEAPLIAVVAQIRFPSVASIAKEEFIGPFQERIRHVYPVLRQEREVNLVLTPDGVSSAEAPTPIWRFLDNPVNPEWKVSLAPSFIALDTRRYQSRADFLERLRRVLEALASTIAPSTFDRLGVRYVDRVQLDNVSDDLAVLIRPEVLGMTTVIPGAGADLVHSLADVEFKLQGAILHGRWGRLPAGAQLDPLYGAALESPSWILDLDVYSDGRGEFDVERLTRTTEQYATYIYRFFRWAVQPELLRRYGGKV